MQLDKKIKTFYNRKQEIKLCSFAYELFMQKNDVLEDKRGENQGDFGFGNDFWGIIPNTRFMKKKIYVALH